MKTFVNLSLYFSLCQHFLPHFTPKVQQNQKLLSNQKAGVMWLMAAILKGKFEENDRRYILGKFRKFQGEWISS